MALLKQKDVHSVGTKFIGRIKDFVDKAIVREPFDE